MSNHSAPCYYHHCAIVNVTDAAPEPTEPADDGGCNTSGGASPLVLIALLALRRRR
jgi:uncharacterized protein (TIGR03382 family)